LVLDVGVFLRDVGHRTGPGVKVVGERILGDGDPFFVFVVESLCFGIETANCIGVLVDEADFVAEVTTFIHDWQGLPLTCLYVNLLNIRRKARAKPTSEDYHLVRFRTETRTIRKWKLKLDR